MIGVSLIPERSNEGHHNKMQLRLLRDRLKAVQIEGMARQGPHLGGVPGTGRGPDEKVAPEHPEKWLDEIRLAIKDARETEPFAGIIGERITDANLFHLAPLVCLKFRSWKLVGR